MYIKKKNINVFCILNYLIKINFIIEELFYVFKVTKSQIVEINI